MSSPSSGKWRQMGRYKAGGIPSGDDEDGIRYVLGTLMICGAGKSSIWTAASGGKRQRMRMMMMTLNLGLEDGTDEEEVKATIEKD